jgi:hypothetical protein
MKIGALVVHATVMKKMTNLVWENPNCRTELATFYPTVEEFVDRVAYLLGLLHTNGIVHGARWVGINKEHRQLVLTLAQVTSS